MPYSSMLWLLAGGIFLLPLFFGFWSYQVFEVNKFFLLLLLGGFSSIGLGFMLYREKSFSFFLPIFSTIAIFLSYLLLQTFFVSSVPLVSFFGDESRHQGFLFWMALFFIFFSVSKLKIHTVDFSRYIAFPLLLSSGLVSALALFQSQDIFLVFAQMATDETLGRSFSTLGQPNFLGQFLIIPLFVTMWSIYMVKTIKWNKYWISKRFAFLGLVTLFVLEVAALFTTGSRSGFLGFFGGFIAYGILTLLKNRSVIWTMLTFGLLLLLGYIIIFIASTFVDSIANLLGDVGRSILVRLHTYQDAIPLISFFGIGLENFSNAFLPLVSVDVVQKEGFLYTPDRAHLFLLDIIISFGILGGVLFLSFLGTVLYSLFPCVRKDKADRILLAGVIGVFISWTFGFPVTTDAMLFFLFLGILVSRSEMEEFTFSFPEIFFQIKAFLLVAFGVFIISVAIITLRADIALWRLYNPSLSDKERLELYETIVSAPYLHRNLSIAADQSLVSNPERAKTILEFQKQWGLDFAYYDLLMAKIALQEGDNDSVKNFLHSAEEKNGNAFLFLKDIGNIWYYGLGDFEQSSRVFTRIIEMIPPEYFEVDSSSPDQQRKFWKHHWDVLHILSGLILVGEYQEKDISHYQELFNSVCLIDSLPKEGKGICEEVTISI